MWVPTSHMKKENVGGTPKCQMLPQVKEKKDREMNFKPSHVEEIVTGQLRSSGDKSDCSGIRSDLEGGK